MILDDNSFTINNFVERFLILLSWSDAVCVCRLHQFKLRNIRNWMVVNALKSKCIRSECYSYLSLFYYYVFAIFRTRLTRTRYKRINICTIKWNESSVSNCIIKCASHSLKHSFRCRFINIHFPFDVFVVFACILISQWPSQYVPIARTHIHLCWYACLGAVELLLKVS